MNRFRYNHNPQQWAYRQSKGLVVLPLALFDPANDCIGRGLLSGSGAYRMGDWTLEEMLELHRGAFALHTRSYQVNQKDRPLKNYTQFYTLFSRIESLSRAGARQVDLSGRGQRNETEHRRWVGLNRRIKRYKPPDPMFVPNSTSAKYVVITSMNAATYSGLPGQELLLGLTLLSSNGYAKAMKLEVKSTQHSMSTPVNTWIFNPVGGYLMPAVNKISQSYCVDAEPEKTENEAVTTRIPSFNHCDNRRPSQSWSLDVIDSTKLTQSPSQSSSQSPESESTMSPPYKVRIRTNMSSDDNLHNELCFTAKPIAKKQFCGAITMKVARWQEEQLQPAQCLGVVLESCQHDSPAQVWVVSAPAHISPTDKERMLLATHPDHEMVLAGVP
eukprot:m.36693 g.36693  ORF g.36693 m.36693 type:complete len:386 (+) comp17427_c0_seq1:44-1201(+)